MPIDPRINCAGAICCTEEEALKAMATILCDCGVVEDEAPRVAKRLRDKGVAFLPVELATVIREIAFPEAP